MVEAVAGGPEVGLEEVGLAWQEDVGPGHGGLGGQGEGCREEEERGEHPTTHSKEGGGGADISAIMDHGFLSSLPPNWI